VAYELPFGVELVRHGGILLEGRLEAGRALKTTATTARAVIRVAGFHGA